jgi:hypothetical protein
MGQKFKTCDGNVTVDMNLQELLPVTKDLVLHVTRDDWQGNCKHIEKHQERIMEKRQGYFRCHRK